MFVITIEDVSNQEAADLEQIAAKRDQHQDFLSTGLLPGAIFDLYRSKWLSDIQTQVNDFDQERERYVEVKKQLGEAYAKVLTVLWKNRGFIHLGGLDARELRLERTIWHCDTRMLCVELSLLLNPGEDAFCG